MFKTILSNFHIEKLIWIIKKNLLLMLAVGLLGAVAGGSYAYVSNRDVYRSTISFYVYSNPDYITDSGVNLSTSEITQAKSLLDSYMQILRSSTFLEEVIEELDLEEEGYTVTLLKNNISAAAEANTAVFYVYVYDEDPQMAMDIANCIGDLAPDKVVEIVKSGGIEVLDAAVLPTYPYESAGVLKYMVLGGAAGFLLVAVLAVIRGLLNTTIRRKYEIEDMFLIPIIGTVPNMVAKKKKQAVEKVLSKNSPFVLQEAYNDLRTNLLFTAKGEKCPVYAITSADEAEGKSFNSINLAIAFSQLGKKVLLIDGDMRKGSLCGHLGLENKGSGLSDYLAAMAPEINILTAEAGFDLIPAGPIPPNSSALLAGEEWKKLLADMKQQYDLILVDLPPIGILSDGYSIADSVTAYLLVVREMKTRFDREEMIVRRLEAVEANICGFLYNGISLESPDYNYKGYGYDKKY